jgi:hypothetical protein
VRTYFAKVRNCFVKSLLRFSETGTGLYNIPLSLPNAENDKQERGCAALMITLFLADCTPILNRRERGEMETLAVMRKNPSLPVLEMRFD